MHGTIYDQKGGISPSPGVEGRRSYPEGGNFGSALAL